MIKKILLYAILISFIYLCIELPAYIGYFIWQGQLFSWNAVQEKRQSIIAPMTQQNEQTDQTTDIGDADQEGLVKRVPHPYLGYVLDPDSSNGVSDYGFIRNRALLTPLSPKSEQQVVIAVFGGSVAQGMTRLAEETLIVTLQESPQYHDKEIVIHNLALAGYKQPQQLMTLNYFLSLGAQFDIVINLDGFNEIALPPINNVSKQVFPFFPRAWFSQVHTFEDPETLGLIGEISLFDERRRGWATLFTNNIPLRFSVISNLIWEYYDNVLIQQQAARQVALNQIEVEKGEDLSYRVTGPTFTYESDVELYQELVRIWAQSSIQIQRVSTANNIAYFHFLQPNQYVPHSKILHAQEQKEAYLESHRYHRAVKKGYPTLIKIGETLAQQGLRFHDLTMIFADNDDPLYIDTCCHLNKQGYAIIAQQIGETINKTLEAERIAPYIAETNQASLFQVTDNQETYYRLTDGHLVSLTAAAIPLYPAKVKGHVGKLVIDESTRTASIIGWAANIAEGQPADAVIILADDQSVYARKPNTDRPGLSEKFENEQLTKSGFHITLPLQTLQEAQAVRVFALSNGAASELEYGADVQGKLGP
ncbi:MAG: hypothetical protein AAF629_19560 [Chloroflexota bacterium]